MVMADFDSRHLGAGKFRIDGHQVDLIAVQESPRTVRKKRANYIYKCKDTLLYNWNPNTYAWSTFGDTITHMGITREAADFMLSHTKEAAEWRKLNNYVLC